MAKLPPIFLYKKSGCSFAEETAQKDFIRYVKKIKVSISIEKHPHNYYYIFHKWKVQKKWGKLINPPFLLINECKHIV